MHGILTGSLFGNDPTAAMFSDDAVIAAMVGVEAALAKVQAGLGIVPPEAAEAISAFLPGDLNREKIREGVESAGVPVPALVAEMRNSLPDEVAGYLHWGATSQDIVDTALCLCCREALDLIEGELGRLIDALETESDKAIDVPMLARTRGQLATPITSGLRIAQWAQPLIGLEAELSSLRKSALRVQFGGASGSRSVVHPHGSAISAGLANELGLTDSAPWHTDRSGFRRLANWLARVMEATGKIGRDIATSSRNEVGEMHGGRTGGSSTMPHKSNPIVPEALQTLVVFAHAEEAALASAAVHGEERDGAMWPVEWVCLPRLFELAGAALGHATTVISSLVVDEAAMRSRIHETPEAFAEAAAFALAPSLGLVAAKALVGDALSAPDPFLEALAARSEFDWESWDAMERSTEAAKDVAQAIFAARSR